MYATLSKISCLAMAGICLGMIAAAPTTGAALTANADWAWMKGATNRNQNGIYGAISVPTATNTPGARDKASSWADGTNALYLFGGWGRDSTGDTDYLNDLWKFDPATGDWTWIKGANIGNQTGTYGTRGVANPANTPGGRNTAATWIDGSGALWLFGGEGNSEVADWFYLNDLWKFDPATTNWTWMKGAKSGDARGTYGTQGLPASGNTPGARYGSATWIDNAGVLWLFGGYGFPASGSDHYLNDLWKYDPATGNWTWIKGSSDTYDPPGVYGTQGVPDPANTPGGREGAVPWTDSTGALWLFGGYCRTNDYNDLWKYDPATTNWTWMKGSTNSNQRGIYGAQGAPAATNTPGAREYSVSWAGESGEMWLFGGWGYPAAGKGGLLNDLWIFDSETANWTWIKGANITNQPGIYGTQGTVAPANTPGARNTAVAWADGSGVLWLFGGNGYPASGSSGDLNDLWKYDVGGVMALATHTLAFSATGGGANPAVQMVGVTNTGKQGFTYTNVITYGAGASGWLTVLPVAGSVALNGAAVLTNLVDISGLAAGTYYATNQVTSANAGNSPQSVVVALTVTDISALPAPTGVSASKGAYLNKAIVTWNAVSGATSYEVWRNTSDNSGTASKISGPDPIGTSYEDTSVAANITYYYWVKAVNGAGASAFSASDSGFPGVVGPLITANGLVGDVYLGSGAAVTIAVQMMNVEQYLGFEVDWWVVAFAQSGEWYYLDDAMQWQSFSGDLAQCHPVYPGPLFHLQAAPVLREFTLPSGTYNFWFAVDYPMDGILNLDGPILFDCVTVIVR